MRLSAVLNSAVTNTRAISIPQASRDNPKVTMLPGNVSVEAQRRSDGLVLRFKLAPEQAAALIVKP